jgi:predicted PhzF superfamily epimerase YddE/YHI9
LDVTTRARLSMEVPMGDGDDVTQQLLPAAWVLRYAAFTDRGSGGNPAGVLLDAADLDDDVRLAVAAQVGYSETAFVDAKGDRGQYRMRFFSALAEVAFCGHATIAAAVAIADRDGPGLLQFSTLSGLVAVQTRVTREGTTATLMAQQAWTTVQLVWPETPTLFHARDPFPPGGVIEDPATGAAAAAFGGYLRRLGLVDLPATVTILQGEDIGHPSRLIVQLSTGDDRVEVTGTAAPIPGDGSRKRETIEAPKPYPG